MYLSARQTPISQTTLSDMPCWRDVFTALSSSSSSSPVTSASNPPMTCWDWHAQLCSAVKAQVAEGQSDYWVKWIVTSGFRKRRVDFMQSRRALSPDAKEPSRRQTPPAWVHRHRPEGNTQQDGLVPGGKSESVLLLYQWMESTSTARVHKLVNN